MAEGAAKVTQQTTRRVQKHLLSERIIWITSRYEKASPDYKRRPDF